MPLNFLNELLSPIGACQTVMPLSTLSFKNSSIPSNKGPRSAADNLSLIITEICPPLLASTTSISILSEKS